METGERNFLWARLMIEELWRLGARCFCLAPGSRCTPLTAAVAMHGGIRSVQHFDERGLAYHALGQTRATGLPAVLICTSGTAAANFAPAVAEAAMDRLPMLMLTADRPPELRDAQANQAIDQVRLFGGSLRWQFDLPCPDDEMAPQAVLTTMDQAWRRALGPIAGPVQINCMYRQPFLPAQLPSTLNFSWATDGPYTVHRPSIPLPDDGTMASAVELLRSAARPMVLIGGLRSAAEQTAVRELVHHLRLPTVADITSGLRLGRPDPCCLAHFEMLWKQPSFREAWRPDLILRIGGRFVGKAVELLLAAGCATQGIRVQSHPERDDPFHLGGLVVEGELVTICERLRAAVPSAEPVEWLLAADRRMADRLTASTGEVAAARLVEADLQTGEGLFLGASLPVRHFNTFATGDGAPVPVGANRGASGIDGTVAAAAGFAQGVRRPVTLVLGDLALLHDLNSLALLGGLEHAVRVIVFNNGGGGIFSLLPIADQAQLHERYFFTPHGWRFEHAAAMFHLPYFPADGEGSLREMLSRSRRGGGSCLIEVVTGPEDYKRTMAELTR